MNKELGKIAYVKFGHVGHENGCLGIQFWFKTETGCVGDCESIWDAYKVPWNENCEWTESDRSKKYDEIMRFISRLLHEAKRDNINGLKDTPVELTFDDNAKLTGWRVLTEVL